MKPANRTYIVSGGSSGLGLATVVDLLSIGAYIAIIDRASPSSDLLSNEKVKFIEVDITQVSQIEAAVESIVKWSSQTNAPLGGVVNSAGVGTAAKIIDAFNEPHSLDLWDFTLAVNLTGSFNLTRLALKHLIKVAPEEGQDGERGVIIFVSSAAAFEGQPGQAAYAATKGALRSMTLPLARDLARHAVRVVTIAPGAFRSAMTDKMPLKTRKSLENEGVVFPRRLGEPEEFARTARWIIECPYVNGETIRSSGLGLATVHDLVDANARVAILDRAIPQDTFPSDRVLFLQIDITRLEDLQHAVEAVVEWSKQTSSPLGGVISCAGIGIDEPIIDARGKIHSIENWDLHLAINLTAPFNLTRLVLEHLIRVPPEPEPTAGTSDGERGVVILVSSSAAYEGMPSTIAYAATKGALRSLALPMARDCARWGIRVVTLAPGPFGTPMTARWAERVEKGMTANSLLFPRRYGAPSEFAHAVRWILECGYVNGEDIRLTGGGRLPARL
ncbi:3-hydroxy-acyl-CoA dehydrogenase [Mycena indigotica]|uniref:3-hydroxy-acyl-CoA dehydrogenase n=1 Tax=Mycena indigotica TaxID=2126181 RepID=A0A8H6WEI9_9AGAR|nr:3-hydroxy-acyl-CoA dehydrogenase [Mycena indigotica]KAF7309519.1 3-hydroxy-acyl-CoA dehydrogenase [Mycena indigotica]